MVTIVKSEWHQVEKRYEIDLDESILSKIYPDLDSEGIQSLLDDISNDDTDMNQFMYELENIAVENNVDIEWYWVEDDWWTDHEGGYEVTYTIPDEE